MAKLWYGHFDSTPEDPRLLLAEDWAAYMASFITDGIRNGGTTLQVMEGQGMTLRVADGIANIQGYIVQIREDLDGRYYPVDVPPSHPQYPRIDRVVLRLDRSIAERKIMPVVILGTAASSPTAPALVRDSIIWDLGLATVRVDAGAVSINDSKITDTRMNTAVCGVMNSILGLDSSVWQVDFDGFMTALETGNTTFLAQRLAEFNTQLESQQTQLSGQLSNQKNEYSGWITSVQSNLPVYAGFDFDNPALYPGTKTDITFPDNITVNEVKRNIATDVKFAERTTVFNADGSITATVASYDAVTGVEIWRRIITTTFAGGDIEEAVL